MFINTSVNEGFPNTFLQAWSRSIPTISTFYLQVAGSGSAPGVYKDSVQGVVEALSALLSDQNLRENTGRRCREYYLRFHTVERIADALQDAITQAKSKLIYNG